MEQGHIQNTLNVLFQELKETGHSNTLAFETLQELPEVKSVPVQMALLTICQKTVQAKTMDQVIQSECLSQPDFMTSVGSKAVLNILERVPFEKFINVATAAVKTIDENIVLHTAAKVVNLAESIIMTEVRDFHLSFNTLH